ncbi:MAG: helix-turn-helix transcriptional regulator [Magnetococcales bacterium]|nr:helix-turn-helix transcriptional regulator [Magnetococcales bacterium]
MNTLIRRGLKLATGHGANARDNGLQNNMQISPVQEGSAPLNAVVIPMSPDNRKIGILRSSPKVILMLSTPNRSSPSAAKNRLLKNLYGLTPAEAHLAKELATGRKLDEVANEKGVSRHTVRTQLREIFAKTGTNRQSELVRLVMMLPNDS